MRSLFRRSAEDARYPLTAQRIIDLFTGPHTHAGVRVTTSSALGITAVYRAVSLIAGSVASLPVRSFRDQPDGRRDLGAPWFAGEPYPGVTRYEYVERLVTDLLLAGNHYSLLVRNETGDRILRLLRLPPSAVQVRRERTSALNPAGLVYKVEGTATPYTPWELMHIPALSTDGLVGLSPIAVARQALGLAIATEEYGARLFGSGALMSGILTTEQALPNEEAAEALKRRWREKMAGVARAHEIAILDRGAKFESVSISPEDAQMLATRQFSIQEVARLFGVPPFLLADSSGSTSWGSGLETMGAMFVRHTLGPWLARIEGKLSAHLLPRGQECRFVPDALLRGSAVERANFYKLMVEIKALTVDEIRDREDLEPLQEEPAAEEVGADA